MTSENVLRVECIEINENLPAVVQDGGNGGLYLGTVGWVGRELIKLC